MHVYVYYITYTHEFVFPNCSVHNSQWRRIDQSWLTTFEYDHPDTYRTNRQRFQLPQIPSKWHTDCLDFCLWNIICHN